MKLYDDTRKHFELHDFLEETKARDCARVTAAYEELPDTAKRLYDLIEEVGLAIERADGEVLEAVADMGRLQSCHCPLGRILQDVVAGELENRADYYATQLAAAE